MVGLEFLNAGRLWLLLIVAALALVYVAVLRWRRAATVRFTEVDLLDEVAPARPRWRRHVVAALNLLGLAAGVVAIARPVEQTTERTASEGRILVLFDVSLSMMAEDVAPDRFEAAKEAARQFVDQVAEDIEVGLVSFSGAVNTELMPTLDRDAMEGAIDGLDLAESTAIGEALAAGTQLLQRLAGETTADGTDGTDETDEIDAPANGDHLAPGAIVLLTDGETTVGRQTDEGARIAADADIPVFTIAFGTPGGTIQDPISGDVVAVPVLPSPLEEVAELTDGVAYEAATGDELADAYDRIRERLGDTLGQEIQIVTELTWKWAAAAFALLAAAWALAMWWLRGLV